MNIQREAKKNPTNQFCLRYSFLCDANSVSWAIRQKCNDFQSICSLSSLHQYQIVEYSPSITGNQSKNHIKLDFPTQSSRVPDTLTEDQSRRVFVELLFIFLSLFFPQQIAMQKEITLMLLLY